MEDDDDFAARSRRRCAPTECRLDRRGCWVVNGGVAFCEAAATRCKRCHGRIRFENWISPLDDHYQQQALKARQQDRQTR